MMCFLLAAVVFLILWPLQMHHWLGETFMNQGMLVKGMIDTCDRQKWSDWRIPGEYYGLTVDDLFENLYAAFGKSIQFYPAYMETYYIVGRYYIDGGSYSQEKLEAERIRLRREGTAPPEEALRRFEQRRGLLLKEADERYQQGRRVLLKDIYMNPNYKWAHNNLGVIYDKLAQVALEREDYQPVPIYRDFARAHYLIALDVDPDQIFALFNLGNGYLREVRTLHRAGKLEEDSPPLVKARRYMERCVEVQPGKLECYDLLYQVLLLQRDYVGLVKCLEGYFDFMTRTKQRVGDASYYRALASAYLKAEGPIPPNRAARPRGPFGEGAPPLTDAERGARARNLLLEIREPGKVSGGGASTDLARMLLEAYVLLGDYEKALEEYNRALEGGVGDPLAYLDLARLAVEVGRLDEAREYIGLAFSVPEDRKRVYDLITGDSALKVIWSTPWFVELCTKLGLESPGSATDEVSPKLEDATGEGDSAE